MVLFGRWLLTIQGIIAPSFSKGKVAHKEFEMFRTIQQHSITPQKTVIFN
jgi:hypothetical protein